MKEGSIEAEVCLSAGVHGTSPRAAAVPVAAGRAAHKRMAFEIDRPIIPFSTAEPAT